MNTTSWQPLRGVWEIGTIAADWRERVTEIPMLACLAMQFAPPLDRSGFVRRYHRVSRSSSTGEWVRQVSLDRETWYDA